PKFEANVGFDYSPEGEFAAFGIPFEKSLASLLRRRFVSGNDLLDSMVWDRSGRFVALSAGVDSPRLVPGVFGLSLAAYWLTYLPGAPPATFVYSTRYLDSAAGWSLVTAIDRHQGAFLPVALFQTAGSPQGVFAVNSLGWIVS